MNCKKYLQESKRTCSKKHGVIKERIDSKTIDLLHAGMGLVTEAGEFLDALKKHIYYGKDLDVVNLKEELGDSLWYLALALRTLETDFDSVMETNIKKLKIRYPEKFNEDKANHRCLDKERQILEEK